MGDPLSTQIGGVVELERPKASSPLAGGELPVVSNLDDELRAQSEAYDRARDQTARHEALKFVDQAEVIHWYNIPKEKRLAEIDKAIETLEGMKKDKGGLIDRLQTVVPIQDYEDNFAEKLAELKKFRADNADGKIDDKELAKFLETREAAMTYASADGMKGVLQFTLGIVAAIGAWNVAGKMLPKGMQEGWIGTAVKALAGFTGYHAGSTLANGFDPSKFSFDSLLKGDFSFLTANAPTLVKKMVEWFGPKKP